MGDSCHSLCCGSSVNSLNNFTEYVLKMLSKWKLLEGGRAMKRRDDKSRGSQGSRWLIHCDLYVIVHAVDKLIQ